ncbi:MAG: cobyric acid synthase [Pseudomonadales bacterium]|nr:cobyric acid synthase [Pseudomonadales bacterium]
MVQGTTSDAGKSVLVAAICRILARKGHSVAPFKPQNMALNSAVTEDGGEIGRAQAVQAEAAFLKPHVDMNPVLLKPNSDLGAQVIVAGKAIGNMQASTYHEHKPSLLNEVLASHQRLHQAYPLVIVEGAGSPAEINLRDRDIANMGFAEVADCPVIIIADIDRGGVFAHLVGTYELLSKSEQQRVVGFVINRFRGDINLLTSGLQWLEQRCNVPVLGVIPYIMDLYIEAEDAIDQRQIGTGNQGFKVVVPVYPRASNHTDFDVLRLHAQVDLSYQRDASQFNGADLIILPGTKNVRDDLEWLKSSGWADHIQRHLRFGGKVIGICGGYQMLGQSIDDPDAIEAAAGCSQGLGLLPITTHLQSDKVLRNVSGTTQHKIFGEDNALTVEGYEIHAGITEGICEDTALFELVNEAGQVFLDGCINAENNVLGSYVHGLFDQPLLLQHLLHWAGLKDAETFDYPAFRQQQFEKLADAVEASISYATWCRLLSVEAKVLKL